MIPTARGCEAGQAAVATSRTIPTRQPCADRIHPGGLDPRVPGPSSITRSNRMLACLGATRKQPCEAGLPRWLVARMAWPASVKKIECGMGALSHSRE